MRYIAHFNHHPGKKSSGQLLRFDARDVIIKVEVVDDVTFKGFREKDGSFGSFPRSFVGKVNEKTGQFECLSCVEYAKRLQAREEEIRNMEVKIAGVADSIYVSCLSRFRGIRKAHVHDQCKITQLKKSITKLQDEIEKLHNEQKKKKKKQEEDKDGADTTATSGDNELTPRLRSMTSMTRKNSKDGMMSPSKRRLTERYFDASEEYIRQQANTAMLGWQLNRIEQVSTKRKEKEEQEEAVEDIFGEDDEHQKFASNSASSVASSSSSTFHGKFDSRGNVAFPGNHDSQSTTASSVHFDSSGRMAAFPSDSQSSAYVTVRARSARIPIISLFHVTMT